MFGYYHFNYVLINPHSIKIEVVYRHFIEDDDDGVLKFSNHHQNAIGNWECDVYVCDFM